MKKMRILMVASEAAPFLRTSDVANVVVELCSALQEQGHDTRLVIPFYRRLDRADAARQIVPDLNVPLGEFSGPASVWRVDHTPESGTDVPVYLVKDKFYFGREHPYGYLDDYERFVFFTRAVVDMLNTDAWSRSESGWRPEVIHGHDWITGLIPFWLRVSQPESSSLPPIAFVYTLHNVGSPGHVERLALQVAGLEDHGIYTDLGESADLVSFMARGIWAADAVNTVSPTHAEELMCGKWGAPQLTRAIASRKSPIWGILNGIDDALYDPAFDSQIAQRFSVARLRDRQKNKTDLQLTSGLEVDPEIPLLGMVTRLIGEKGLGIIEEALPELFAKERVQVVILGALGDFQYQEALAKLAEQLQGRMKAFFGFNERQARRIFAGSDIILVPSLQEPCGLQQMIAMRYGAIPLVRKTGGLADTVSHWRPQGEPVAETGAPADTISAREPGSETGRGFVFDSFDKSQLLDAIREALGLYRSDPRTWEELRRHNMALSFSWRQPAVQYVELYSKAVKACRERAPLPRGKEVKPDRSQMLVHALLHVSDLATAASRSAYLKRAARLVRELLHCDGVLFWVEDEAAPHLLRMEACSLAGTPQDITFPQTIPADLGVQSLGPQYVFKRESDSKRPPVQQGFLRSEAAEKLKWQVQLTVPMNTRGMVGRIDVFFCNPKRVISEEDKGSLSALANGLASTLERIGERLLAKKLQAADQQMMAATTLMKVVEVAMGWAKDLVHGDGVALCLPGGQSYTLAEVDHVVQVGMDDHLLESVLVSTPLPVHPSELTAQVSTSQGQKEGELRVWRERPGGFSHRDELALQALAGQVAAALQATRLREEAESARPEKLRRLSHSLTGFVDLEELLQSVVETTAEVLAAEAASLFMVNETGEYVEIKAAAGYHKVHLGQDNRYSKGQGLTAWLWEHGETVKLDSLDALHKHPGWQGRYKKRQGDREPNCFLGIPLKVIDRHSGKAKVIGVLKLEDRTKKPDVGPIFNDEDQRLGEMMANVTAAVVYNTQVSGAQLQKLSGNLEELSKALAGGQEMGVLVKQVVGTIARVLGAEASSLYLFDEATGKLVIKAATGYQEGLVQKGVTYGLGEGITGWIAKTGERVRAKSLEELRRHPKWLGKHNPQQANREPDSFLGMPLRVVDRYTSTEKVIGVLKVENIVPSPSHPENFFTDQDMVLVGMMANVIATVVYNTQVSGAQLQKLSGNLEELSKALAGGQAMGVLVKQVVGTIARVLGAEASSLYFFDEATGKLVIKAATGYQEGLVQKGATYGLGEGITGWIAQTDRFFRANSLEELRRHPKWLGKHNPGQGSREPDSFLGMPLRVVDRYTSKEKVIGVLKVEDIVPSPSHPDNFFTDQDVALVGMMANVIATVVYNTQVSGEQLQELSSNLTELSKALAGGGAMHELVARVVQTTAKVMSADASSLYLIDEATHELVIQAATGYQETLVAKRARYRLGEGITGWIAKTGSRVRANSLEQLRQHPSWKGKQNPGQGDREPKAFLGVPLRVVDKQTGGEKVIGVLKVEDIVHSKKHPEPYFTDQDELLVTMMADVIATVVHNTQMGFECNVGLMLRHMGRLSAPQESAAELLLECACTGDEGTLDQLAISVARQLDAHPAGTLDEAKALFEVGAQLQLYRRISDWAKNSSVTQIYSLLHAVLCTPRTYRAWEEIMETMTPWLDLANGVDDPKDFSAAVASLTSQIATATHLPVNRQAMHRHGNWHGVVLDTTSIFANRIIEVPVVLYRGGKFGPDEQTALMRFVTDDLHSAANAVLLVDWNNSLTEVEIQGIRNRTAGEAVDVAVANPARLLQALNSPDPANALRGLILRQTRAISPFVLSGPVPESMFFGRNKELRRILNNLKVGRSSLLIGARRIGKTSILQRLHRVWLKDAGFRSVYFECGNLALRSSSPAKALLGSPVRDWFPEPPVPTPRTFGELLELPPSDKPLALLLDEVDTLLPGDRQFRWPLFRRLRALTNSRALRVVFCGAYTLREAAADAHSPFYNLADTVVLGLLGPEEVEELICRPFKEMEIELADGAIVQAIYDFTSGHPNVVQRFCERLVERLKDRPARRITMDDVTAVRTDPRFQRDDFLEPYWEQATELERIISLVLAAKPEPHSLDAIRQAIVDHLGLTIPVTDLAEALIALVELRHLLRETERGYEFAVPSFPKVVAGTLVLSQLLQVSKAHYQASRHSRRSHK